MPYHLREIPRPRCRGGTLATVELYNASNAPCGAYCRGCGAKRVREENRRATKPPATTTAPGFGNTTIQVPRV